MVDESDFEKHSLGFENQIIFVNGNLTTEAELMAQIIHRNKVESK